MLFNSKRKKWNDSVLIHSIPCNIVVINEFDLYSIKQTDNIV